MKLLVPQLYYYLRRRPARVNILNLLRFLVLLALMITVYSVTFHLIMQYEGRTYSWVTGLYWTLTVMSTLGFGDITFYSDLGRVFSTVVLLSGIIFLLVLLPFTFIEFFYEPWLQAQKEARAPRSLPEKTRDHVILTAYDAVSQALIERLEQYHYPYVLLAPDLGEALRLHDLGYRVVRGDLDNPDTYRQVRVDRALLVATTHQNDRLNTNVAFTVREVSDVVPIVATANTREAVDILQLAGSNHVLHLGALMGQGLARRVIGGGALAHVIGSFGDLLIAEATVEGTPFIGQTLRESQLRNRAGINVLGAWKRGTFEMAHPEMRLERGTVLVAAGTQEQVQQYNSLGSDLPENDAPVVIIGGGRVGRATARALIERGIDYRIVEMQPTRVLDASKYVIGDAADLEVLEQAGIRETRTVVVTSHDDDTNIFLTLYCRRLRPEIQIISRSRLDRNVATLHRAGADFVMSYASIGATMILNLLNRSNTLMVAEGLDLIKIPVPSSLRGRTIAQADVRRKTGATIVAVEADGVMHTNPDPQLVLPSGGEIVLIGSAEAENKLLKMFAGEIAR